MTSTTFDTAECAKEFVSSPRVQALLEGFEAWAGGVRQTRASRIKAMRFMLCGVGR